MPINTVYRGPDGATLITGSTEDLGAIVSSPSANVLTDPVKVCVENVADRVLGASPFNGLLLKHVQVGTSDAVRLVLTALDPNGTLSRPWGAGVDASSVPNGAPTTTDIGGPYGNWVYTGTRGIVVTALNGTGETIASAEATFDVADVTHEWRYDWEGPDTATLFRVYRTDVPGSYGAYSLIYEGSAMTFTDDGSPESAGTPPDDNSTGGAGPYFGDDPLDGDFSTSDITIAESTPGLAVGQQFFFYLRAQITAGLTSTGNTRRMDLIPTEV